LTPNIREISAPSPLTGSDWGRQGDAQGDMWFSVGIV
jgi:hypothetical protein